MYRYVIYACTVMRDEKHTVHASECDLTDSFSHKSKN